MSYNTVCIVKTALAEVSELHASLEPSSGLQPIAAGGFVHTFFWADNFDKKVKSDKIWMMDSTHMIKFQEKNAHSKYVKKVFHVVKKRSKFKSWSLTIIVDLVVNDKLGPKRFISLKAELDETNTKAGKFYNDYFLWLILRHKTGADKLFPNFAALRLTKCKEHDVSFQETVVTYLIPINSSVNSFSTIYQYL